MYTIFLFFSSFFLLFFNIVHYSDLSVFFCVCVCVCVCVWPMCLSLCIRAYMYTHTLPSTLSSAMK